MFIWTGSTSFTSFFTRKVYSSCEHPPPPLPRRLFVGGLGFLKKIEGGGIKIFLEKWGGGVVHVVVVVFRRGKGDGGELSTALH